jgi:hypothetical protein
MDYSEWFERSCEFARNVTGVSCANSELAGHIPAIDSVLELAGLKIKGEITEDVSSCLGRIFTHINALAQEASTGDSVALAALNAIDSLVTPNLLNISLTTLNELADRKYKSWFARATRLTELMSDLSWVVEPTKPQLKMTATVPIRPFAQLSPDIVQRATLWTEEGLQTLHAFAVQHCRKNTTLQASGIKLFNFIEERDAYTPQDERVLKRDLQMFKQWVDEHPTEVPVWLDLRDHQEISDE